MARIFHPATNAIAKITVLGAGVILALLVWLAMMLVRSSWATGVDVVIDQPVPFSHEHHVRHEGIDCRYCHTSVEDSSFAGIPPTEICMNCHREIWKNSPMLEPVRESYRTGKPLVWNRVHDLPDFVYFNHSIHVKAGIGCSSCHGRVDRMPLMHREYSLYMIWCLDCHRNPEEHIRPREYIYEMDWPPSEWPLKPGQFAVQREREATAPRELGGKPWYGLRNQEELGKRLIEAYHVEQNKDSCDYCHR